MAANLVAGMQELRLVVQDRPLVPKKVISFDGENASFHHRVLHEELEKLSATIDPSYIIGVAGRCRSGKSFLINLMIQYLDYYCQNGTDEGWEKSTLEINGVDWAKGKRKPVTHGVWLVVYPQLIGNRRLVLLDFQGTADKTQSTPTLDKMILFYCMKLSNLGVLNVDGNIDTTDLNTMSICTLEKAGAQLQTGFESFLFLVRNWEDEGETETLEEIEKATESAEVRKTTQAIRKACKNVNTKGLPHPGKKVTKASKDEGLRVCDVDNDFATACRSLFKSLLIEGPASSSHTKPGYTFEYNFKMLGYDTVGKVESSMEASINTLLSEAWSDAQSELQKTMGDLIKAPYTEESEIDQAFQDSLTQAEKAYNEDARVVRFGTAEKKSQYLDALKELTKQASQQLKDKMKLRKMKEKQEMLKAEENEQRQRMIQLEAGMIEQKRRQEENERNLEIQHAAEKQANREQMANAQKEMEDARVHAQQLAEELKKEEQQRQEIEKKQREQEQKLQKELQRQRDRENTYWGMVEAGLTKLWAMFGHYIVGERSSA